MISFLIEKWRAQFTIKNKLGKSRLDYIKFIENFIQRVNYNNMINDFEDIKPLIKLLKNNLSIKSYPSNNLNENNADNDNINLRGGLNSNNLIKLSSLSTTSTNSNSENNIENCNNVFVKFNPLSLIVDTQFNDNNKNFTSNSQKIEYYSQINKNKKYLLNLLKQSENNIKEMSKLIEEKIKSKKEEVKRLKNKLKEKENKLNEMNNNYLREKESLNNDLATIC